MNLLRYTFGLRKIPFVRDVLTIQYGSLILMAAGFLSSVAFARFLGKDDYGSYAVILAFAGTATAFFNIGQGQSLYTFFSESFGKKDRHGMAVVLANFFQIAIVNIVLLVALAWLMPMLSLRLYGTTRIGELGQIICLFQISEIWNSMTLIILQSIRRIRLKVFLEQAANLSYLFLAILILALGGKIQAILLTQLLVSIFFLPISLVTLAIIAKKHSLPGIREALRIPFRESRQYLAQGLIITTDKTIGNFFPQGLFFLLSLFTPASFIGIARISLQLANIPRSILLPQVGDLSTTAFASMMQKEPQMMRSTAAKLIKHALVFHAFITFVAACTFPFVIRYFYGAEYWDAIPLTLLLLPVLILSSLTITNAPILRLYRKMHWSIVINLFIWLEIATCLLLIQYGLSPVYALILACIAFYGTPILATARIFTHLLQEKKVVHDHAKIL